MRYIKASKVIKQRWDIYSSERFPISSTLSNPITVLYISKRILFGKRIGLLIAQQKFKYIDIMNGKDNMYLPVCDISDTTLQSSR